MSPDATTRFRSLTRAQWLVLATLQAQPPEGGAIFASSRHLALQTGLSRRTIQAALHRLNQEQLLATRVGDPSHASSHQVLDPGKTVLAGISAKLENCATPLPKIAPPPCGFPPTGAENCATPVENSASFPQKATSAYRERARTSTSTLTLTGLYRATDCTSESTGEAVRVYEEAQWKTPDQPCGEIAPPPREEETESEITVFVEVLLSDRQIPSPGNNALLVSSRTALDPQTRANFEALPAQFRITPGTLCRFLAEKAQQKYRSGRTIFHAGALLSFCVQDLPDWIAEKAVTVAADKRALLPVRKPPVSAPGAAVAYSYANSL